MMVKWSKDGLLQANAGKMLVYDGEILVNDGEILVNDGEMNIWSTLTSSSVTSILPSYKLKVNHSSLIEYH